MRANILLHPDSLKRNPNDSESEYMEKFSKFTNDVQDILINGLDDHFIFPTSLYSAQLFEAKTIFELSEMLGREEKEIIYGILTNKAEVEDCSIGEYKNRCQYTKGEEVCSTMAILNEEATKTNDTTYIQFDNYEIVYGYGSWQTFRRQILGNHPESASDFISCAKILFPSLYFHPNCEDSVADYLNCIPRRIVYYLSCMNDNLIQYKNSSGMCQANDILEGFSVKYGLDKCGSIEMRPKHKPNFTYHFMDKNGNCQRVCCEPHLKINKYDSNYSISLSDRLKSFNARIYFHFGDPDIQDGKILVGSIGPHA